ncbi:DnaJ domain-containing protein [Polynucleobacter sp. 30F-ANTBAC]|uniref:J domain-containing protein n=1 Tax=Polynucleobacter sp. 30F-ANTBAC TaxID=2689095 RepID=UPI001C0D2403|nr:DnaJ domain-containing protein [Polynucleobacter sp. 30F-ANTBAC]MBU3600104.1 DnaJ domain-containing protein [Polynucleobacter sp. 30F-ANTBAC]
MTSNEVWVVIVLGLVGYWGTSALIKFFKKESEWTTNQQSKQNSYQKQDEPKQKQESSTNKSWFEILEVHPSASLADIKTAYKKKISMYHPDKVSSMGPEFNEIAQKKSKEINAAYDEAIRLKS